MSIRLRARARARARVPEMSITLFPPGLAGASKLISHAMMGPSPVET